MKKGVSLFVVSAVMMVFFCGSVFAAVSDIGSKIKEKKQQLEGAVSDKSPLKADLDTKISAQQKLIDGAVSSKSLTKDEAKIVQENLSRIKEKKKDAGGKMDELQQGNLQNMLDRNNKMITDKKNNPVRPFSRPEITHRFSNQQKRIDAGIKSGALTKQEAATLQENLTKAKAKHAELSKDGKFTQAEEDKMHDLLDKDSQVIDKKKHN